MFKVRVHSLCEIGTADNLCAKAELRDLKPMLLCGSRTPGRSIFLVRKWNYGESKHHSLCRSGIADLKGTQYSMCGSGTAELKVSVYS